MSHPDALPDLFIDRSLGRIVVPTLLRAAGLRLTTLSEHYGIPEDEAVTDEEWLELAGSRSWIVFMKDARIRYTPAEREAVKAHRVRCFCLSNQNLTGEAMATRFLDNLDAIVAACIDAGPSIYASTPAESSASRSETSKAPNRSPARFRVPERPSSA